MSEAKVPTYVVSRPRLVTVNDMVRLVNVPYRGKVIAESVYVSVPVNAPLETPTCCGLRLNWWVTIDWSIHELVMTGMYDSSVGSVVLQLILHRDIASKENSQYLIFVLMDPP